MPWGGGGGVQKIDSIDRNESRTLPVRDRGSYCVELHTTLHSFLKRVKLIVFLSSSENVSPSIAELQFRKKQLQLATNWLAWPALLAALWWAGQSFHGSSNGALEIIIIIRGGGGQPRGRVSGTFNRWHWLQKKKKKITTMHEHIHIWCKSARLTTLVARSKNGVIWICYMLWSSNFQGISRNYYSF